MNNTTELLTKINWNVGYTAAFILLISVALSTYHYSRLSLPFRRLYFFLIWNLAIEISSRALALSGFQNLPLLHLYTLGEFILLLTFYKSIIHKPVFFQRKFFIIVILGSSLIVLNTLLFQNIFQFNAYAKTSVQVFVIGLAVTYFYHMIEVPSMSKGSKRALRLINSAIMVYYSGSLFVFMCSQIYIDNPDVYAAFWVFNAILNLIFQFLILWALSMVIFKKTQSFS